MISIEGFESQRVQGGGKSAEAVQDLVYKYVWTPQRLGGASSSEISTSNRWLVFADRSGVGERLCGVLKQLGFDVTQVNAGQRFESKSATCFTANPESLDDFRSLLQAVNRGSEPTGNIVYLWGLDAADAAQLTPESLRESTHLTTLAPMHLVQAWEQSVQTQANLAIVTRLAQATSNQREPVSVAQSPLIGFGRVIVSEYASLRTKLIDLPSGDASEQLLAELQAMQNHTDGDEDEIAWRQGERLVHRFVQADSAPLPQDVSSSLACRLSVGKSSGVEELQYRAVPELELSATQIEIDVLATGLNFSDVMKALELYPGMPDGPVALGAECCGRVRRVRICGHRLESW